MTSPLLLELKPNQWNLLNEVAELDREAFAEDGLTPANLVLLCHSGRIFILQEENVIIASAIFLPTDVFREFLLFSLAVRPSFRRQGKGGLLLQSILATLAREGCTRLILTVGPENQPALSLYTHRLGFRQIARLPDHFGPGKDRLLMEKVLIMADLPKTC